MKAKYVSPSVNETSFNCPHCGAFAQQFWFSVYADNISANGRPTVWHPDEAAARFEQLKNETGVSEETLAGVKALLTKMASGSVALSKEKKNQYPYDLLNVWLSRCYNCDGVALWRHDHLVWPAQHTAPFPNGDLPEDVRADYDEAATIVHLSPRGAAGLLRLALQKLCRALGQPGKNLNEDIAKLVSAGLDTRIQQALDIVRVIGNNAVHPGQIDLSDDANTATQLFNLVNLIADRMITEPKAISAMYDALPVAARQQIETRDKR